jgi:hypothetical protein
MFTGNKSQGRSGPRKNLLKKWKNIRHDLLSRSKARLLWCGDTFVKKELNSKSTKGIGIRKFDNEGRTIIDINW